MSVNRQTPYIHRDKQKRMIYTLAEKLRWVPLRGKYESINEMSRVEGIPEETLRKALLYPPAVPAHPFVGQKYSLGEAKEEVLRQLLNWIEDFNSAGIPLPFRSIVCSYENLVGLWNRNHTNRITLYSEQGLRKKLDDLGVSRRRMYGERLDADHGEAHDFVGRFGSLVSEYDPDLVFNFDETAFYWKQSIDVTYCVNTIDPSGGKVLKNRVSVGVCANMTGSFRLRPLILNDHMTNRSMGSNPERTLPISWLFSVKGWMTREVFQTYINGNFTKEIEEYCERTAKPFKVLLFIDNCPSHLDTFPGLNDRIKILFLPKNTTSIIQPMDQGVIRALKCRCKTQIASKLVEEYNRQGMSAVVAFKKSFQLVHSLRVLTEVWNSLEESTLRNAWKSVRGDMSREQATAEDRANVQSFFRELQSVVGEVDSLFPTGSQEDFYTSTHPGEHLLILPEMMSFVGTRMAVLADQEISQPAPALPVAYDTTPNSEAVPHESNHGNAVCQVVANDLEIPLTVGPTGWAMYLGHEEDFYLQQASACLSIASRLNRENKRLREPAEEEIVQV